MNEFLLVMIDRLSTQNKTTQNRQAAVASYLTYTPMNSFPHNGHEPHGNPPFFNGVLTENLDSCF
ncbi:hypothetical protein Amal_03308 [Acetobacter malorum]|uniref:Uncharacterized protein n=1 Tax=Acetobacter malorum TaxID=178901 RepID=A0A177G6R7_9PROT|nr:hypothetical protein Amal_03308 [Acetobacter malorum]